VSALTSSLGLAWKAGIAAEVLAYTSNSIGREIYFAKSTLEMTDLFAWTITVVIISMVFEYAVKQLFKLLPRGYRDATK
jgi:NitT/TauT family transport system permease protein